MRITAETYGLSLPDLQDVVSSKAFSSQLLNAASSNVITGYEVGFAVYSTPDGPSDIQLLRAQDTPNFVENHLDIAALVENPDGSLRHDLGLMGHTHPDGFMANIAPSGTDLCSFTEINRVRPGVIDSVAILRQNLGIVSLMLFRGWESNGFEVIRRPFNVLKYADLRATFRAMRKADVAYHALNYDFATGQLLDSPEWLSALYT